MTCSECGHSNAPDNRFCGKCGVDMGMDWWTAQAEGLRGRIDGGEAFVWFATYVDGPPGSA